ncbi:MAG TPA: STAS domain-containing protein [Terriglobales bacterium]|nr:STAS domain-containing protein [Terriglobales bacterium]
MFADRTRLEAAVGLNAFAQMDTDPRMQRIGETLVFQWSHHAGADEAELLATLRSEAQATSLVLDLAPFESIGPSRLGTLVAAAREAARNAIRLKLMNVRPGVEAFLRENNLLSVFEMCTPQEVLTLWCRAVRCSRRALPAS